MSRGPLFRCRWDAVMFVVVVLLCLPLVAFMALDPTGFTLALGQAVVEVAGTILSRLVAFAPFYIVACVAFTVGYLFRAALHPQED